MSKSTTGRRRGLATLATTALVAGACFAGAGAASADAGFHFNRISGEDRYGTAAAVQDAYGDTNDVIIANGAPGNYADALSANYLSGVKNAPILLTKADTMPAATQKAIKDSGAHVAWIVGGTDVVSQAQEDGMKAAGLTVHRIAGADRFKTDAQVINEGSHAKRDLAIVATGFNFPDALAGGPLAYTGSPVALTTKDKMDQGTVSALQAAGITKAIILGGTDVVAPTVEAQLKAAGITVVYRADGADRAETSVKAAEWELKNAGFSNTGVDAASGYVKGFGADALAGGPLAGKENRPLLVTKDVNIPGASVIKYLTDHANTLHEGDIFGGPAAISLAAQDQMEKAAQSVTSNQSYSATPSGATTVNTNANNGDTKVTFSGITAKQVSLRLIDCKQDSADQQGQVSFADANNNDQADLAPATNATITQINGVSSNYSTGANNVDVQNGTVTVTVNSNSAGCSQLVAFEDKNNDGQLNLDANNKPTEPFAVSGALTAVTPAKVAFANSAPMTPYGSYTSTAQLEDSTGKAVELAGVPVKFSRTLPDGSTTVTIVNTDAKGQASITFSASDPSTNSGDTTQETVTATPDLNQDGDFADSNETAGSATQTVTFSDQAATASDIAVTSPAAGSNHAIGSPVTATAKVTDQYGAPVSGKTVHFATATGYSGDRTTGADGTASFTYTYNGVARDDTVTATTGAGQSSLDDSVTFHWSNGVATVNGTTYPTLEQAINAAHDGDTITATGTFAPTSPSGDVVVNKDVTIDGGGTATLNGGFQVAASGVTIKGFKINVPANNQGVELQNGLSNVTVTGNTITGNGTSTTAPTSATGVTVNDTNGTVVSNNTISKLISGISTDSPSGSVSITGNTISSTSSEGIGVNGPNVSITGNTFKTEPNHVVLYMAEPNTYLPSVLASNTFDSAKLKDANNDGDYGDAHDAIVTPTP